MLLKPRRYSGSRDWSHKGDRLRITYTHMHGYPLMTNFAAIIHTDAHIGTHTHTHSATVRTPDQYGANLRSSRPSCPTTCLPPPLPAPAPMVGEACAAAAVVAAAVASLVLWCIVVGDDDGDDDDDGARKVGAKPTSRMVCIHFSLVDQ